MASVLFSLSLLTQTTQATGSAKMAEGKSAANMTHNMTDDEKHRLFDEVKDLSLCNILQREDAEEIYKIILRACNRTVASIDDPQPKNMAGTVEVVLTESLNPKTYFEKHKTE